MDADRTYYAVVEGDYEFAIVEREYLRGNTPSVCVSAFGKSLDEEERMAKTVAALVQPTTHKYIELTLGGQKADR